MENADVNYNVAERDLKYYIFDWDNNILHMPTRIHLDERKADGTWAPCAISTSQFARIRQDTARYRPPGGDWERAFVEFRDLDPQGRSQFLDDTRRALEPIVSGEQKPAPSFNRFRQALVEGRLFAIVTARGHSAATVKAGVQLFIETVLAPAERAEMLRNLRGYLACFEPGHAELSDQAVIENYLGLNRYHAITSPDFRAFMRLQDPGAESQEKSKQLAIRDFVRHVIAIVHRTGLRKPVSIGFSDDDIQNVGAAEKYIREELGREFPGVKFVVYDTSDPELPSGRKMIVQGQLDLRLRGSAARWEDGGGSHA